MTDLVRVVDPADPTRCQGGTSRGQCPYRALEGGQYCSRCVPNSLLLRQRREEKRQYLLAKAEDQALLAQFAGHQDVKSLRDEIALTRMMIQETWNSADSEVERLQAYSRVNTHLLTLERLVKTCHALEQSLGKLLSKDQLLTLGQRLCQVVIDRLEGISNYEEIVEQVIDDIVSAIEEAGNAQVVRAPR